MTEKTEAVHAALGEMNHADAEQWDKDGKPLLEVVRQLAGDDTITEADFDEAALAYRRANEVQTGPTDNVDDRADAPDAQGEPAAGPVKSAKEIEVDAAKAQAEADKLLKRIEPLQKKQSELKDEINKLQKERDKQLQAATKYNASRKQTEAIQSYFKSQDRAAAERHEMNRRIAAAMLSAGAPAPKAAPSTLDSELARKTGHGKGRKPHPQLFQGAKGG